MTYDEINPAFREAIGVFEGLRKLGFQSKDIYYFVGGKEDDKWQFVVKLLVNQKQFLAITGLVEGEPTDIREKWRNIIQNFDEISQGDLDKIWQECRVFNNAAAFVLSILNCGIIIPKTTN